MSFFDNILDNLGLENPLEPIFKIVIYGDNSVYIEGVKSIKSYSKTKIEIQLYKGGFNIVGEELYIKKYCLGDLLICGKILSTQKI